MAEPDEPAAGKVTASPGRSASFSRLGVAMTRRPWLVIGVWVALAVAGLALVPNLLVSLGAPSFQVDGSPSARAEEAIAEGFPAWGNEQLLLVLRSERYGIADSRYRAAVDAAYTALRAQPETRLAVALPPPGNGTANELSALSSVYQDPRNTYVLVAVAGDERQRLQRFPGWRTAIEQAVYSASGGTVTSYLLGPSAISHDLRQEEISDARRAEAVAVPLALLLLVFGLGALGTAVAPLAVAAASISVTLGMFAATAAFVSFDVFLLTVVSVVGLGLSIDYALLMAGRFREELATGACRDEAVGRTVATAGRTVFFAGVALVVAAASLLVVRVPVAREAAVATMIVALVAMAAALTLLPAVLALSGSWLDRGALPWRKSPDAARHLRWKRWARHLMRHPWPYTIGVTLFLLIAAAPTLGLRTGIDVPRAILADTATGKGLAVLDQDSFAGVTGVVTVLVQQPPGTSPPDTTGLVSALRADPRTAVVVTAGTNRHGTLLLVVPKDGPGMPPADALVTRIRDRIVPASAPPGHPVLTGGLDAAAADLREEATAKLWWVIGLALAAAFLYLMVMLRSILLPLKAIMMNLLATGAAYGLLVVVFQYGVGEHLFGFTSTGSIQAYWPVVMFIILFALSLDYEIFLVRRIQEEYQRHGDNSRAVADGLQRTAHSISLAAATLVLLFASLLTVRTLEIKQVGFALAVAVTLDATLIRLVLVPALMQLFGRWNWWLPAEAERRRPGEVTVRRGERDR